jgi:hypothetical protein
MNLYRRESQGNLTGKEPINWFTQKNLGRYPALLGFKSVVIFYLQVLGTITPKITGLFYNEEFGWTTTKEVVILWVFCWFNGCHRLRW